MQHYKYQLQKGSKKHRCPSCHKKRFVRYIDIESGDYLTEIYGKCDREINCAYHLNPYKNGFDKKNKSKAVINPIACKTIKKPLQVFFPKKVFEKTKSNYEENTFIQNLLNNVPFPFEVEDIEKVIAQYHLGTISKGYRKSAVTFPFIDINCNVRAVQVKQFDDKNHTIGTDFLHSMIEKDLKFKNKIIPEWLTNYNNQDTKVSCFFGEHLLRKYPYNPIGLVEAPKTAVYNTLYFGFPENHTNYLWLAVFNLSSLSFEKCKTLKGRNVYLFPDLSKEGRAFKLWSTKAKEYEDKIPGTSFIISDLLEKMAPSQDREQGKDIADYIIKLDWRDFRTNEDVSNQNEDIKIEGPSANIVNNKAETEEEKEPFKIDEFEPVNKPIEDKNEDWSDVIKDLEDFFSKTKLPKDQLKLNNFSTILDCSKFIESHLCIVKANNGKNTFVPYLDRLIELKNHLLQNYPAK
jgi:hypothetical protein